MRVTFLGAVTALFNFVGAGVALAYPDARWFGFLLIAVGFIPLAWWAIAAARAPGRNLAWRPSVGATLLAVVCFLGLLVAFGMMFFQHRAVTAAANLPPRVTTEAFPVYVDMRNKGLEGKFPNFPSRDPLETTDFKIGPVYLTNTSVRRVTIEISLQLTLNKEVNIRLSGDGKDAVGQVIGVHDKISKVLREQFGTTPYDFLLSPVTLDPNETKSGTLVFRDTTMRELQRIDVDYLLEFRDVTSGKSVFIDPLRKGPVRQN